MKKMFPSLFRWMLFWIWFISVVWIGILIVNAAWDSTKSTATDSSNPSTNQKLTASEWNSMVSYVKWMRQKNGTKIYYNGWNVWIWTNYPTTKLQVNWNIRANNPIRSYHVATKEYVDNNKSKISVVDFRFYYDDPNCKNLRILRNGSTSYTSIKSSFSNKHPESHLGFNYSSGRSHCVYNLSNYLKDYDFCALSGIQWKFAWNWESVHFYNGPKYIYLSHGTNGGMFWTLSCIKLD